MVKKGKSNSNNNNNSRPEEKINIEKDINKSSYIQTSKILRTNGTPLLTSNIAQYLWLKYSNKSGFMNWKGESDKSRWIGDAENIRQMVDEYYEE